jgi:hypothetical protein
MSDDTTLPAALGADQIGLSLGGDTMAGAPDTVVLAHMHSNGRLVSWATLDAAVARSLAHQILAACDRLEAAIAKASGRRH